MARPEAWWMKPAKPPKTHTCKATLSDFPVNLNMLDLMPNTRRDSLNKMATDQQIYVRDGSGRFYVLVVLGLNYLPVVEADSMRINTINSVTQILSSFQVIEYYIDEQNGLRFESETVALRYLETGEVPDEDAVARVVRIVQKPKPSTDIVCIDNDNQVGDDSLDWLPVDWEVDYAEEKNGMTKQSYIEPTSGFRFSSKEDVLCYLQYEDASTSSQDSLAQDSAVEEPHAGTSLRQEAEDNRSKSGSADEKRKGTNLKKRARAKAARDTDYQVDTNDGLNPCTDLVCIEEDTQVRRKGTPLKRKARSRGNVHDQNVTLADDVGCSYQYTECYIEPTQGCQFGSNEDVFRYHGQEASTSQEPIPLCIAPDSSKCKGTPLKKIARSRSSNDISRFEDPNVDQSPGWIPSSWGAGVGLRRRGRKRRDITDAFHFNGQFTPLSVVLPDNRRRWKGLPTRASRRLRGLEPELQPVTRRNNCVALMPAVEVDEQPTQASAPEEHTTEVASEQPELLFDLSQDPLVDFAVNTVTGDVPVGEENTDSVEEHPPSPVPIRILPDLNEPADEIPRILPDLNEPADEIPGIVPDLNE